MAWFKREKSAIENPTPVDERRVRTEGLWTKCSACRAIVWKKDLEANWDTCPKCEHHFRLGARRRFELLLDGVPVHRRLDGRSGGRKSSARHRAFDCAETTAGDRFVLRWRAHDGRH